MNATRQVIAHLEAMHPDRTDLGVCVATLKPTGGCMDRARAAQLLRADFHLVVLCTGGAGDQVVDLAIHHHEPGTLLWIRPGQVHERPPAVEGTAVCFTDAFLGSNEDMRTGPNSWKLDLDDFADVRAQLAVLTGEYTRFVFGPTGRHLLQGETMLRHVLLAFLLRVGQAEPLRPGQPSEMRPAARAFIELVEGSFASIHTVGQYAAALGYSAKTLTRASVESTGLTPKQVIDARLVLESRRLLTYSDISVSAVGRRLGFDDPANFCKFFTRATGMSPGAFRASRAADRPPAVRNGQQQV
ncbi:helix-turn-helix domain-containing protein [Pengzhenrongella phosphoraccumulans]|uniref:helix-turn-helix domain-containing protein n=1 Tax=Pengzhenrongella phosphoraccumulans TaxID=3114394 RepID=UPI00388D97C0